MSVVESSNTTTETNNTTNDTSKSETQLNNKNEIEEIETETSEPLNPNNLYSEAKALIQNSDFESAIDVLSQLLEHVNETKSIAEDSFEMAQYFALYGKALLKRVQSQNQVLGESIQKRELPKTNKMETIEETLNENEEINETKTDNQTIETKENTETNDTNSNTNTNTNKNIKSSKEEMEEPEQAQTQTEPQEDVPQEEAEAEAEEQISDSDLCWEYLEYSRIIMENLLTKPKNKNNKEYLKLCEEIHSLMGEHLLEVGQYDLAYDEFVTCIELHADLESPVRVIASAHFWASLAAQYCNNIENMDYHRSESEVLLADKIKQLLNDNECKIESECDFETILETVDSFLQMNEKNNEKIEICKEIKDLKDTLNDLVQRSEEEITENNGFDMEQFVSVLQQGGLEGLAKSTFGDDLLKDSPMKDINSQNGLNLNNENIENESFTSNTFDKNINGTNNETEIVNELTTMNIRRKSKKRSMEDAEVSTTEGPKTKKQKLNPTN